MLSGKILESVKILKKEVQLYCDSFIFKASHIFCLMKKTQGYDYLYL